VSDEAPLTNWLRAAGGGDGGASDRAYALVYAELRRLAARQLASGGQGTLTPTALVNEAYLKLADSLRITPESRLHFQRIAARAMRQVLVEAARRRHASKRGGARALVTFDESVDPGAVWSEDVLALDAALGDLARISPRQAALIEYRFFGGFNLSETAQALEVSEATIDRDWRAARAWLGRELKRTS